MRLTPKETVGTIFFWFAVIFLGLMLSRLNSADLKGWAPILLNAAPLFLLVGFCLFLMKKMQRGEWRASGQKISATRTGIGYDLHRLESGRKLIVGGIELPFDKGPVGHSDGDVLAQTPQAFSTKLLREAFARAQADGVNASDEAGLVERMGHDVHVVLGSERNMKITKPADMELARFYMEREKQKK